MAKCEAIDLTLSASDSDGDFIQAKKAIHPFLYQASVYYMIQLSVHQVLATTEIISLALCMYIVMYCKSHEVRQTHLHYQKLEVSLCDDNLSEGETIYWL